MMAPFAPTLEERVRRLEALEHIRTLKGIYHTYINDTAFEKVGELFTENASVKLGYLMPTEQPVIGRAAISAAFAGMKTDKSQSQVKQFIHSHLIDLTSEDTARGTGLLYACYGIGIESYVVAGKYVEDYKQVAGRWLFQQMELALYFTVPLRQGWAGHKRHYLVNSGPPILDYQALLPNPAV